MFLLFGNARAVLIDTGATPVRRVLPAAPRRRRAGRTLARPAPALGSYALLVLHTHAHGDHVAG